MCASSRSDAASSARARSRGDDTTVQKPAPTAVQYLKAIYGICRHVRSAARDGQRLPRLTILLAAHSFVHAALIFYRNSQLPIFYSSDHLSISAANTQLLSQVSLGLLVGNLIVNIAGYVLIYRLYQQSVSTIFNRIAPEFPSAAFVNSFGAHIALLRPLEIIFRYLTARFRVLPDVIVLGEVRCGTTTLGQHLSSLPGCHQPFCLWKHPELDGKETFYFVGHYLGKVDPLTYRMCFPLKLTKWWNECILRRPFFTFDGCAQYLTSPTAAALIAETYRRAGQDPPVLVACVRSPVDQAISWWRYENNAIEWGTSMGLTAWNADLRTKLYPPHTIGEALKFSTSEAIQRMYSNAEDLVKIKEGGSSTFLDNSVLATRHHYRLPPWAMTWPGGQLSTIGRNGRFSSNISRFENVFAAVFPNSGTKKKGLKYVFVVPLECMSAGLQLAEALSAIMERASDRCYVDCIQSKRKSIFNHSKQAFAAIEQAIRIQFQNTIKVRRNSGTKLSNSDMEPTSQDEILLSKYFRDEIEILSRMIGFDYSG